MSDECNKYNAGEFERGKEKPSEFKESTIGFRDILDLDKHKKHLHMNPDDKSDKPIEALPMKDLNEKNEEKLNKN